MIELSIWSNKGKLKGCLGNPDAKRLYDDLLSNYNKLVRPVVNVTDALTVKIKLKLSQLIDVCKSNYCLLGSKENVSNLTIDLAE
uniref:Neur_chan_LBD domain-containing protein n=1 Tax=Rhodnius prolixus TaxID=13249 RepID=T1ICD1_RHOPR